MNNITLVIDGNWLLMSRMYPYEKKFHQDSPLHLKLEARDELVGTMAKSIAIVLNKLTFVDNIVLVTDGDSWRKKHPVPISRGEAQYKGNRDRTQSPIDWYYVFEALDILSRNMKSLDITVCQESGCEGDDWCWFWSRYLNSNKTSCILWTEDQDIQQLIQHKDGVYTTWYNTRKGMVMSEDSNKETKDDVEFFMIQESFSPHYQLLTTGMWNNTYVNPEDIIMDKIICGDLGDNILSVVQVEKGGRKYGVGPNAWNKIRESLSINTLEDFYSKKIDIINNIKSINKFSGENSDDISALIDYNNLLVRLDESCIPEEVQNSMKSIEYLTPDISQLRRNYKILLPQDTEIEDIFNSLK